VKGDIHVMPINDLLPHYEREDCHCDPEIKVEGGKLVIVHNSFDGREFSEPGHEPYRPPEEIA